MTLISKNFSEVITFSRGTGATRVNSAGLIVGVDFSATSNTITTGSKTFTLTADANVNRDWAVNANVIAVSQAGATGSMTGVVTSYTPSTQSLVINVTSVTGSGTSTDWRIGSLEMREDYDSVTLVRKGVLSEVSATNTATNSNAFNASPWIRTGVSINGTNGAGLQPVITPNAGISPDGSNNATRIVLNANGTSINDRSGIYIDSALTNLSIPYTFGIFVKPENGVTITQILDSTSVATIAHAGLLFSQKVTTLGNGWFYIQKTFSVTAAAGSYRLQTVGNLFPGELSLLIYGYQFEINSATSYIPTTTAQVTRNADNFPLTASAVASIRQGEGTLYAEIDCPDTGVAQKRALRLSGTNADIRIGKQGTGTLSNFTKMVEGAGLRLMGTSTSLIRGNGQDLLGVTAVSARTGVAGAVGAQNAIAFDGNQIFGKVITAESFFNVSNNVFTNIGHGAFQINGAHWSGNSFLCSSSIAGLVVKSDGTSYRVINTPVITQPTNEITSGLVGGTLRNVIVGNAGFIATSDNDGETWTSRTSGTTNNLQGVSYGTLGGATYFITAGVAQTLRYSTDTISWTNGTGQAAVDYQDVHIANNIGVAVGVSGAVYTTTNGTTWTAATSSTSNTLLGVTYASALNLWVAVGQNGTVITATNPAGTWTPRTSGVAVTLNEVGVFNNAIYIVGNSQTLLTSSNGTSYTSLNAGVTANLFGIAASPTTLLITGSGGAMASSTDGTNFTSRTNNSATLNGIAFGNNVFVSVGNAANGSGYIATIGADGTVTRRVSGTTAGISNVKFLNGRFVGNSSAATTGVTSVNGDTWSSVNFTTSNSSIAFGNGIYIANRSGTVSGNTVFIVSTDLATFTTPQFSLAGADLSDIEFANGLFVAVGAAGAIVTITNSGTTLTPVRRTSNTTQNLNSVMFSTRDNLWYAAGDGGVLLYSPDAITWTAVQNSGTASILGTTLQSNQPLPQFKSGVNKIALSYKSNQVISALNGVASTTDTTATIPSITAGAIGENFNGTIQKIEVLDSALTTSEIIEKTL